MAEDEDRSEAFLATENYVDNKVSGKYTLPEDGIPKSDLSPEVQKSLDNADAFVQNYVNNGSYDSEHQKILLKHDDTTIASIDASAFVKDGMVSSAVIENSNLVISFNTDAGHQPISIPLTDIFNPNNYYDKEAADNKFSKKINSVAIAPDFNATSPYAVGKHVTSEGLYYECKVAVPQPEAGITNPLPKDDIWDAEHTTNHWIVVDVESMLRENSADILIHVTWQELVDLRTDEDLVPGGQYRITDYVATTNGDMSSRSANHPFDIIVTADDEGTLNEKARAIPHEGDTYFTTAGANLAAWEVWYSLDNDTNRFAWALADGATDSQTGTTGRGVIFRLIDEWRNDVPYDFKGIQFLAYGDNDDVYRYTFDSGEASGNTDFSLNGSYNYVWGNTIRDLFTSAAEGRHRLNQIVFKGYACYSNTFGDNCSYNTFGDRCYSNTFGDNFNSNTFGDYCQSNTFGDYCQSNTFGDRCYYNTFGDGCYPNTFGDNCYSNTFGNYCYSNTFGGSCQSNTFGDYCYYNTFGHAWRSFRTDTQYAVGDYVRRDNIFYKCTAEHQGAWNSSHFTEESPALSYYRYITLESGVQYIALDCTATRGTGVYYQNVTVAKGVLGTDAAPKRIADSRYSQGYKTTYQPENSRVINI